MNASNRLRTTRRAGVAGLVAAAVLVVPHPAAAFMPVPPSPVKLPVAVVGHLVLTLAEEYAQTPTVDKRRLHNEIVLLVNAGLAAI
ncbi:hypothetical protein GCM10009721_42340 [Terrabacter tumescens]|uniref:Uncharacterized protein n=1 Tax=Terrabacter tumescens TaxID=60443 RepID=A0ABQ2IJ19_9MICO|nr:hypothetical protein [Terrabacter tumescens]GGN09908.1 hypothetical protein GCM10009721_42340 [Terrabacter tumescens]